MKTAQTARDWFFVKANVSFGNAKEGSTIFAKIVNDENGAVIYTGHKVYTLDSWHARHYVTSFRKSDGKLFDVGTPLKEKAEKAWREYAAQNEIEIAD